MNPLALTSFIFINCLSLASVEEFVLYSRCLCSVCMADSSEMDALHLQGAEVQPQVDRSHLGQAKEICNVFLSSNIAK